MARHVSFVSHRTGDNSPIVYPSENGFSTWTFDSEWPPTFLLLREKGKRKRALAKVLPINALCSPFHFAPKKSNNANPFWPFFLSLSSGQCMAETLAVIRFRRLARKRGSIPPSMGHDTNQSATMLDLIVQIWFDWMSYFCIHFLSVDSLPLFLALPRSQRRKVVPNKMLFTSWSWMCVFWWEIVILKWNFDEKKIDKLIVHAQHFAYKHSNGRFLWHCILPLSWHCVIVTAECVRHVFVCAVHFALCFFRPLLSLSIF